MEAEVAELKKQVAALTKELTRVAGKQSSPGNSGHPLCNLNFLCEKHHADCFSDESEVRKTHFKYGYYLDKCLYNEVRPPPP